jgi:hypothetical protein
MPTTLQAREMAYDRKRLALWTAMGAGSGTVATFAILVPEWVGAYPEEHLNLGPVSLDLSPLSIAPGLVFGLIAGLALAQRGMLGGWRYPAYIVASTASYSLAYHLSIQVLAAALSNILMVGIIAGTAGAAMLMALSAWMMRDFRQRRVFLATVGAGAALGALLAVPIAGESSFFAWLALFGPWQAGYAGAMTTAFRERVETGR